MGFGVDLGGNFGFGGTRYEMMNQEAFSDFAKALQAGYGTDVAALTGGGALRVQSLDNVLYSVTQTNQHFKLWNELAKTRATATVDEWVRKPSTGGFMGSAFNSELGAIQERTGTYERKTGSVKYLMTRRSVSFVQMQQKTIIASEAEEQVNGTRELLQSVEWSSFYGDGAVIAEQFDGLKKILTTTANGAVVLDARGAALDPTLLMEAAQQVAGAFKWGRLTHMFLSHAVQADLDTDLDPSFRVPLTSVPNGGINYGAPVVGIRTSWGDLAIRADPYVRESWKIFGLENSGLATSTDPTPPVSASPAAAPNAASKFEAAHAGAYRYAVVSVNRKGVSTHVKGGPVTVAAGDRVTVTITEPASGDATGYYVYRTNVGSGDVDANFRYIGQIADSGAATTLYLDDNVDIPGTSDIFLLNLGSDMGPESVSYRQLLPMTKFALFPTNTAEVPWAQLLFLYLRVTKPEQCAIIRNVLPKKSVFRPFA